MKKIYFILFGLLPMMALAQPTTTQSDLPVPGTAWISSSDHSYTGAIPAGGANVSWDYSGLTGTNDTTAFRSATGSPYAGTFPAATCAQYDPSSGEWQYFEANSTGFYLLGGNQSPTLILNPGLMYVPVPFTYNSTRQTYARFQYDTTVSSTPYREVEYITSDFVADGWGTLTLPSGVYPNVLREKSTMVLYDSIYINLGSGYTLLQSSTPSQEVDYRWVRDNATTPVVLEINADSAGTTATKSSYLISSFILSANDLHVADNALNLYPNPASNSVHFDVEGIRGQDVVLQVYNPLGQVVVSQEMRGITNFDLPVDKYDNGIYFYSVTGDNAKRTGKFTVAH